MLNVLSVDVEEYFHPSEVQSAIRTSDWDRLPSRVYTETMDVLELFDRHNVRGTFFILGWVAERHPRLVREISAAGHEIGCHSYAHELVYRLTPDQFRHDVVRAVQCIGDAAGLGPRVYRAPSYSVTEESMWALEILVECGFTHDSSIYPICHDRYGIPGFGRHAQILNTPSGPIKEVPIATARLAGGRIAPVGGGGYLRLLPCRYSVAGIRRINNEEREPACIYFHPWELDVDQPRLAKGFISRTRTYMGLRSVKRKLERLLTEFHFSTLTDVHAYEPVDIVQTVECR